MEFTLRSPEFRNGHPIPVRFTGDGDDVSPPLEWSGAPEGTQEFALVCDDPDAPRADPWVHWIVYGIPGTASSIPEDLGSDALGSAGLRFGTNDFGNLGYGGPAPPRGHGVHHYHFKLFALDSNLLEASGMTKRDLLAAMRDRALGVAECIGTYERRTEHARDVPQARERPPTAGLGPGSAPQRGGI